MQGLFVLKSGLLGVGLAMDAFSVSLANGMQEPGMQKKRIGMMAGVYALFQFAMPMIGWVCVHAAASAFGAFEKLIPWIALFLLLYIGGKMLYEGCRPGQAEESGGAVGIKALLMQGIATSIDALSVGFTISEYNSLMAFLACLIIALVTFVLCWCGILIGRRFGVWLANRASVLGGVILIVIGIEIFVRGVFFGG